MHARSRSHFRAWPRPQHSLRRAACLPHLHPVSGSTATEPTTIRSTLILSSRESGTPYLTTPAARTGDDARQSSWSAAAGGAVAQQQDGTWLNHPAQQVAVCTLGALVAAQQP